MRPPDRETMPEESRVPRLPWDRSLKDRLPKWPLWLWIIIIAVLMVPALGAPAVALARYTTSSAAYCANCHSVGDTPDRGVVSLVHPGFKDVACVDCHARPGQVVFEGYRKGFMAEPERTSGNCVRCHQDVPQRENLDGAKFNFLDIKISHKAHLERGATCATCHTTVAHDLQLPPTNRPRMETCNQCHGVKESCANCHNTIPAAPAPVPAVGETFSPGFEGRALYLRTCAACHGQAGDRLAQADLGSEALLDSIDDAAIARIVKHGGKAMPALANLPGHQLTSEQIASIVGYLRLEAGQRNAPQPKALYDSNCIVCHGADGNKVSGITLFSPEFLQEQGEALLTMAILDGRGGMPAFGRDSGGALDIKAAKSLVQFLQASAATSGAQADASGADGKALYAKSCAGCHGPTGSGLPTADLSSAEYLAGKGAGLVEAILKGKGGMPALGKEKGGSLSEGDANAIVDYLKQAAGGR